MDNLTITRLLQLAKLLQMAINAKQWSEVEWVHRALVDMATGAQA